MERKIMFETRLDDLPEVLKMCDRDRCSSCT